MTFLSVDPANGEGLQEHPAWDGARLDRALDLSAATAATWVQRPLAQRSALFARAEIESGATRSLVAYQPLAGLDAAPGAG